MYALGREYPFDHRQGNVCFQIGVMFSHSGFVQFVQLRLVVTNPYDERGGKEPNYPTDPAKPSCPIHRNTPWQGAKKQPSIDALKKTDRAPTLESRVLLWSRQNTVFRDGVHPSQ